MQFTESAFPSRDRWNDRMVRELRCTGPASYTTGGDAISGPRDLGFGEIYGVYGKLSNGTLELQLWWDYANQKLKLFVTSTGAEVANGVDLSAYTGTLLFTGKG